MATGKLTVFSTLLLFVACLRLNEHKQLDRRTKYPWTTVVEQRDAICLHNFHCDGLRLCVQNVCQGVARPPKDFNYHVNETATQGRCPDRSSSNLISYRYRDYYCPGEAKCLDNGQCEEHIIAGTAKYPWYTVAEGSQSRCTNNWECDGARICHYRFCNGVARPAKNPAYVYDESITKGRCPYLTSDRNYANRDYYCNSSRKCSAAGRCEDLAAKSTAYVYDQRQTYSRCPFDSDPNVPVKDYFCDGLRTCSQYGWCQGTAR